MTAWLQYRYGSARERWWVQPPYLEESIDSVLERASHIYGGIALQGRGWLTDVIGARGVDDHPLLTSDLLRLARLLSTSVTTIRGARVPDSPATLTPAQRRAYCPECWSEDDAAGRARYFRRDWARVLALACKAHRMPLMWAPRPLYPMGRVLPLVDMPSGLPQARELLDIVEDFATRFDAHWFAGEPWPAAWALTGYHARALLCHCLAHLEAGAGRTVSQAIWQGPGPPALYQTAREDRPAWLGSPWEAVRRAGPPSWRRVSVWIVASVAMPDFPRELLPGGVHSALRDAAAAAVDQGARSAPGRRLSRLRRAFLKDRLAWTEPAMTRQERRPRP